MYAYDYNLFYKAQMSLAWMFDYGVLGCNLELNDFYSRFLISDIAHRFEKGESAVIAGMSGVEMAMRIISQSDSSFEFKEPVYSIDRSREYWIGWSLAYYQWSQNIPFEKITENITINDIADMYPKYHEMDIRQFADRVDEMSKEAKVCSSLRRIRTYAGLSQSELSTITDIPLRTIQAYEQTQKNINNASVDYVCRLSKALSCNVETLLEL